MNLDTTINLEGAAAAIGILIAAIGYIISLITSTREKRRWKRERVDDTILLEILEEDPLEGLDGQEVLQRFRLPEYEALGKRLGASRPDKVTADYLEGRLRALQYDHFVDRTVSRKYVLRTGFEKSREREKESAHRRGRYLRSNVDLDKVLEVLRTNLGKLDEWDRRRTIEAYPKVGTQDALDELVKQLKSTDPKLASTAAWEIAELLRATE